MFIMNFRLLSFYFFNIIIEYNQSNCIGSKYYVTYKGIFFSANSFQVIFIARVDRKYHTTGSS